MAGEIGGGRIEVREIDRFPNTPLRQGSSMHWDIKGLLDQLRVGLRKAAGLVGQVASISTDSWGVDYVLFGADGQALDPVFHYRDPRTTAAVGKVNARVGAEKIFAETGIQFLPINTIYQLATESPERLAQSQQLLLIADAFNYFLSGVARAEESLASTTQLYNPIKRAWSAPLLQALDLPERIFPTIVPCGSRLGRLDPAIARDAGLPECDVVASCSHDTAAAVVAVPAEGEDWAYISSGTWSLLGVEVQSPVLTEQCRALNFTNEVGFGGTIRLLKNIAGLWIVQECRRDWEAKGEALDYAQLTAMAAEGEPFRCLIHPGDARFLAPDDMPEKIASYCRESGQPTPRSRGEVIRCALESLALLYQQTLRNLETLIGRKLRVMHIVGGGSRNGLLNQFTANAAQIPVLAGPVEATTIGNVAVQAMVAGELRSIEEARALVRSSSALRLFQPTDGATWAAACQRFEQLNCSQYSQPECE
jgi:rhamnulokinase